MEKVFFLELLQQKGFNNLTAFEIDQDFKGTIEEWAKTYLKHFVAQVYRRSEYVIEKSAKPFEKYID